MKKLPKLVNINPDTVYGKMKTCSFVAQYHLESQINHAKGDKSSHAESMAESRKESIQLGDVANISDMGNQE